MNLPCIALKFIIGAPLCVLGLLLLSGCEPEPITIENAWTPEIPAVVKVAAGYLDVTNNTQTTKVIIGVQSRLFEKVEVHKTLHDGDIARMIPIEKIPLKPGKQFQFSPGGAHLMLIRPKNTQAAGDIVPLELLFEDGGRHATELEVRKRSFRP